MDSQANDGSIHFVLFPFMAQGHLIPIIDCARMLAQRGVIITIVTTPLNAARSKTIIDHAIESGLGIQLIQLPFPCGEATGLPSGCESLDALPSRDLTANFFAATAKLQLPVEILFKGLTPPPCCIISDTLLPWTIHIASKFHVPRISFLVTGCFSLLCGRNYYAYKVFESVKSESEYFVMPGIPDCIEFTKAQLTGYMHKNLDDFVEQMLAAEAKNYGLIINTFEELEAAYVKEYKKTTKGKLWCIGPVSLCNKKKTDMAQRGNKLSNDGYECLEWLDSQKTNSVVYACLGSLCNLIPAQLIELGLGLELSNRPFIWVIRGGDHRSEELEKWIVENKFEERTKGRGILIRGWAPQALILSHPALGGFLTHCGWNSTLEGICGGVPMITWPLSADQFCNEKLVVQTLKIGVRVGVEIPVKWGEEENIGVLVSKEDVKTAVEKLMNEGEDRRRIAKELGEMAKRATEEGGSSQLDITMLIQDIAQQASKTLKD
ncbi:Glycosyltransferase [Melia azedarach]|uniref:Glycosyltransferase n=1 Tax=Melia azedarach TaxID=155640 RepID=A0ACC1X6Q6_MELAZ|nr:Glycosyltransferase [Melia azedarach]